MSTRTTSTEVRADVRAILAAARVVVDGYERHITASVARVRALIREGERWADEGGEAPPLARRYAELARAYETPCRCNVRGRCSVCKALRALGRDFATPIDLEIGVLAAFQWIAGAQPPDVAGALEELGDALRRVTDHLEVSNRIMDAAYAAAGHAAGRPALVA